MEGKTLSIFIDESGDFGSYEQHAPYYIVSMVLHDQSEDVQREISGLNERLTYSGYANHTIHTGPLIRREQVYKDDLMEDRQHLFNMLFQFTRLVPIKYISVLLDKRKCDDIVDMTVNLSKLISAALRKRQDFFDKFDRIIIYYDNGQVELTKILTSLFAALFSNVEFRRVRPIDYKLFQAADLICTLELLSEKADHNKFTKSEEEFFGSPRQFKKDYLKKIRPKGLL